MVNGIGIIEIIEINLNGDESIDSILTTNL